LASWTSILQEYIFMVSHSKCTRLAWGPYASGGEPSCKGSSGSDIETTKHHYCFCFIYLFCDHIGRCTLRWTWLSQIGPQVKIIAHRCISGWLWRHCCSSVRPVFPKLGANYPLGAMCNSSRDNTEPKPQCCSVLFFLWRKILRVIRHNRNYDLSNGSNKFGNHCAKRWWDNVTEQCFDCDRWWRNNTWTVSNIFTVHLLRK